MKKSIRLTESELHGMIGSIVENVLNELDWRTYASAANKAYRKGNDNIRARRFDGKADMEFGKNSLGKKTDDGSNYQFVDSRFDGGNAFVVGSNSNDQTFFSDNEKTKNVGPDKFNGDNGLTKRYNRLSKMANDFNNGKTTYRSKHDGGQGWANYDEAIIREAVMEVLKKLR